MFSDDVNLPQRPVRLTLAHTRPAAGTRCFHPPAECIFCFFDADAVETPVSAASVYRGSRRSEPCSMACSPWLGRQIAPRGSGRPHRGRGTLCTRRVPRARMVANEGPVWLSGWRAPGIQNLCLRCNLKRAALSLQARSSRMGGWQIRQLLQYRSVIIGHLTFVSV